MCRKGIVLMMFMFVTLGMPLIPEEKWVMYEGHFYYFEPKRAYTDASAKAVCKANGAYMARLDTIEEGNFFVNHADKCFPSQDERFRIDMQHTPGDPETDWYTSNGNPASPAAYTFWLPGSPNSFDSEIRLCARFRYKSRYNAYLLDDADCENTLGFICERDISTMRAMRFSNNQEAITSMVIDQATHTAKSGIHCIVLCLNKENTRGAAYNPTTGTCQCSMEGNDGTSLISMQDQGWHVFSTGC